MEQEKNKKTTLKRQKCYHHAEREAVAMCLECKRHFCRECITKHEERFLCTTCLTKIIAPLKKKEKKKRPLKTIALFFFAFLAMLLFLVMFHVLCSKLTDSKLDRPSTSQMDKQL